MYMTEDDNDLINYRICTARWLLRHRKSIVIYRRVLAIFRHISSGKILKSEVRPTNFCVLTVELNFYMSVGFLCIFMHV